MNCFLNIKKKWDVKMKCKICGGSNIISGSENSECKDCGKNLLQLNLGLQFQPKSDDPYHDIVCKN